MRRVGAVLLALVGALAGAEEARTNVLLICVDDLRPELACFGADHIHSPNIDRLASEGRPFFRHYVQAPTCGASRYTLLTGCYGPAGNGALMGRAKRLGEGREVPKSLPGWFRRAGYQTVSVGKVSHHPGGLGGADWDDPGEVEMPGDWVRSSMPCGPWRHPRGAMHGLADGEVRGAAGTMAVMQAKDVPDSGYPDGLITEAAVGELRRLAAGDEPFFLAVGLIRPHLPFGAPEKYYDIYRNKPLPPVAHPEKPEGRSTWQRSGEFRNYDLGGRDPNTDPEFALEVRRHYAACVSYADAQVGKLLAALEESGSAGRTVVVLWGDHGWHLGERAVWGKHTLFEESLRAPLVVRAPGMNAPGSVSRAVVETIDLFPTLCGLAGLAAPAGLDGRSLVPQLEDPTAPGHEAVSYTRSAATLRTAGQRLVLHRGDGFLELYDDSVDGGTPNVAAERPEDAARLRKRLEARLGSRR